MTCPYCQAPTKAHDDEYGRHYRYDESEAARLRERCRPIPLSEEWPPFERVADALGVEYTATVLAYDPITGWVKATCMAREPDYDPGKWLYDWEIDGAEWGGEIKPTHWMPLPAAPDPQEEKG